MGHGKEMADFYSPKVNTSSTVKLPTPKEIKALSKYPEYVLEKIIKEVRKHMLEGSSTCQITLEDSDKLSKRQLEHLSDDVENRIRASEWQATCVILPSFDKNIHYIHLNISWWDDAK